MYNDSNSGRKPLPFAMAEKIDNAVSATMVISSSSSLLLSSLELSDTKVYEPYIRALLGTVQKVNPDGKRKIDVYLCSQLQPRVE